MIFYISPVELNEMKPNLLGFEFRGQILISWSGLKRLHEEMCYLANARVHVLHY
ncbi:hypothetical protein NTG1052_380025 [Candidatus Nitrotoga sp. 1052]|nr:hypothetical protein NTG1052_380025 [Candidatus Nitrotoga sp. 1052]